MVSELHWRAFCWYEGIKYKREYGGALWLRYYREFKWMRDHDRRYRDMMDLSA